MVELTARQIRAGDRAYYLSILGSAPLKVKVLRRFHEPSVGKDSVEVRVTALTSEDYPYGTVFQTYPPFLKMRDGRDCV